MRALDRLASLVVILVVGLVAFAPSAARAETVWAPLGRIGGGYAGGLGGGELHTALGVRFLLGERAILGFEGEYDLRGEDGTSIGLGPRLEVVTGEWGLWTVGVAPKLVFAEIDDAPARGARASLLFTAFLVFYAEVGYEKLWAEEGGATAEGVRASIGIDLGTIIFIATAAEGIHN
jgi:hypothetical protein